MLVPDNWRVFIPEVDEGNGEKEFKAMSFEGQMKEWEDLGNKTSVLKYLKSCYLEELGSLMGSRKQRLVPVAHRRCRLKLNS